MREIRLYLYPEGQRYRAVREPDAPWAEAWPVRRYTEDGIEILEAVVMWPGAEGTRTYRFTYDGANWRTAGAPIAQVRMMDLFV